MLFAVRTLLLCFLLVCESAFAQATGSMLRSELPLWEAGVGIVAGSIPDYPGAGHSTFHTVPIPGFIYRGKRVRADEDGGLRARFYKTERWEFDLSIGGSLPASSEENAERKGMPDLDTMGEIGPTFIWKIIKPTTENPHKLILSVPLRFAGSTDLKHFNTRGVIFNPILVYMRERVFLPKLTLILGLDVRIASDTLMDYFYSVSGLYVTQNRPGYEARAGYMGTNLTAGFSYFAFKSLSLFGGVIQSSLHGASNIESPLLVKKNNTAFALGMLWWFYESKRIGVQ
jgi:outer membrane protein